jgi:large subunit ribosomal protein L18
MLQKKLNARRRASKTRIRIRASGKIRLCIHRTLKHFYVQLIAPHLEGDQVLASVSTLDKEVKTGGYLLNNIKTAEVLGATIAKRALACNIRQVVFDRAGYKYHGRVKALAQAARAGGLEF